MVDRVGAQLPEFGDEPVVGDEQMGFLPEGRPEPAKDMEGVVHEPHGEPHAGCGQKGRAKPVGVEARAVDAEEKGRSLPGQDLPQHRNRVFGRQGRHRAAEGGQPPGQFRFEEPPRRSDQKHRAGSVGAGGRSREQGQQGQLDPGPECAPKRGEEAQILSVEVKPGPGDAAGRQVLGGQGLELRRDGRLPQGRHGGGEGRTFQIGRLPAGRQAGGGDGRVRAEAQKKGLRSLAGYREGVFSGGERALAAGLIPDGKALGAFRS